MKARSTNLDAEIPDTSQHLNQHAFVHSEAKRNVVRAGRRGGKTYGIAIRAVKCFLAGKRVLYAAPTQDQLDRFWVVVCRALQKSIDAKRLYKNETRHILEIPGTEQRIRAKTAWNADSLRGDYADELILDEWQLMNEDAWRLVGAPMLADNNGNATFIYTPPSLHSRSATKADDPQHAAKLFKKASNDTSGRWAVFHFGSKENPYISAEAVQELAQDMTALAYRMEIEAEDVEEAPGALWTRDTIDSGRVIDEEVPELERIVVALDPSAGDADANPDIDECGIMVVGRGYNHGYLLADKSLQASPATWAKEAVNAYHLYKANAIVAEANNGGEMVRLTIQTVDPKVSVILVHASRGKQTRAEPVAAVYEHGRGHHVGVFPKVEDEMCLAPDTLISTIHGSREIQTIRKGDLVFTRKGPRQVLWAGQTGFADKLLRFQTRQGRYLMATAHHPIYNSTRREFVKAGDFNIGDSLEVQRWPINRFQPTNTASRSFTMDSDGLLTTAAITWTDKADYCIASSGQRFTAQSQKVSISTTRTRIGSTTTSLTWSASALSSIAPIIPDTDGPQQSARASLGISNDDGLTLQSTPFDASDVAFNLKLSECGPCFAGGSAEADTIESIEVIKHRSPVYNLTVEGEPEFYANGILVHNCLWLPGQKSPNRMDALVWGFTELGLFKWRNRSLTDGEVIEEKLVKVNPNLSYKRIEQDVSAGKRDRTGALSARNVEIERIKNEIEHDAYIHPLADTSYGL